MANLCYAVANKGSLFEVVLFVVSFCLLHDFSKNNPHFLDMGAMPGIDPNTEYKIDDGKLTHLSIVSPSFANATGCELLAAPIAPTEVIVAISEA